MLGEKRDARDLVGERRFCLLSRGELLGVETKQTELGGMMQGSEGGVFKDTVAAPNATIVYTEMGHYTYKCCAH